MFEKVVVVDAKGHLIGRLASLVTKELMNGQHVAVVRCEDLNQSGSLFRNKLKYQEYLDRRTNTNPRRGPFHWRSPARMFWRTVRGMMKHFTKRCQAALARLKVFEGVPHPYDKLKRQVVPEALRYLRLRPGRKYCRVGDLSAAFGWKHNELIGKLEAKRKTKSAAYYATKKSLLKVKSAAIANAAVSKELAPVAKALAALGH